MYISCRVCFTPTERKQGCETSLFFGEDVFDYEEGMLSQAEVSTHCNRTVSRYHTNPAKGIESIFRVSFPFKLSLNASPAFKDLHDG